MMNPSKRGAARVNVIWMIVSLVAFFIALTLAITFNGETKDAQAQRDDARAEAASEVAKAQELREEIRELSKLVGFYDPEDPSPKSDQDALKESFETFKGNFPEMGAGVVTIEQAMGPAVTAYNARVRELADVKSTLNSERNNVRLKTEAQTQLASEKDSRIRELESQLNDATQAATARQADLENELASVRNDLGASENTYAELRGEMDDLKRKHAEEIAAKEVRLAEMGKKIAFLREPEKADGQVLAVDAALDLAWINLGTRQRLFRGMRFRIVDAAAGSNRVKAWATVRKVEEDRAEVVLSDLADRFDPPTTGDLIFNPIYDPGTLRNAVLLGRFSGTYNEKELRALLAEINVNVQGKVDATTDYLIVGAELYYDEDGEPLEEPLQPSDLAEYKKAVSDGVQIVPLKQVREYFRRN